MAFSELTAGLGALTVTVLEWCAARETRGAWVTVLVSCRQAGGGGRGPTRGRGQKKARQARRFRALSRAWGLRIRGPLGRGPGPRGQVLRGLTRTRRHAREVRVGLVVRRAGTEGAALVALGVGHSELQPPDNTHTHTHSTDSTSVLQVRVRVRVVVDPRLDSGGSSTVTVRAPSPAVNSEKAIVSPKCPRKPGAAA